MVAPRKQKGRTNRANPRLAVAPTDDPQMNHGDTVRHTVQVQAGLVLTSFNLLP